MQRTIVAAHASSLEEWARLWQQAAKAVPPVESAGEIAMLMGRAARLMHRVLDPTMQAPADSELAPVERVLAPREG